MLYLYKANVLPQLLSTLVFDLSSPLNLGFEHLQE